MNTSTYKYEIPDNMGAANANTSKESDTQSINLNAPLDYVDLKDYGKLESIEKSLNHMPEFDDENVPNWDKIIENLNHLQIYFLRENMQKSFKTVWWSEQVIKHARSSK